MLTLFWEEKKSFKLQIWLYFWLWHAIIQADKSPGSSRRSSLYPTTSRRCSEAVAAYAASGDIEAVAEMLRKDKLEQDVGEEDEFVLPPEKERKRLVLVVSCVGLTMTFLAAIMVGITLGFSQTMDDKVSSKPLFLNAFKTIFIILSFR